MPSFTYGAASISIQLSATPLESTITRKPVTKKGSEAQECVTTAQAALKRGTRLEEKYIADDPEEHVQFLGPEQHVPFFLRGITWNFDALMKHSSSSFSVDMSPRALVLQVLPLRETFRQSRGLLPTGRSQPEDLMISVFYNGDTCDSRFIPSRSRNKEEELPQLFSGIRFGRVYERPWVIVLPNVSADGSVRVSKKRKTGTADRWAEISASLKTEAKKYGFSKSGKRQPLGECLDSLAALPIPAAVKGMEPKGGKFGVLDVVVSLGKGKKRDTSSSTYLLRPAPMRDSRYAFQMKNKAPEATKDISIEVFEFSDHLPASGTLERGGSVKNQPLPTATPITRSQAFRTEDQTPAQGTIGLEGPTNSDLSMDWEYTDVASTPEGARHHRGGVRLATTGQKGPNEVYEMTSGRIAFTDPFNSPNRLSPDAVRRLRNTFTPSPNNTRIEALNDRNSGAPFVNRVVLTAGGREVLDRRFQTMTTPRNRLRLTMPVQESRQPSPLRNESTIDDDEDLRMSPVAEPRKDSAISRIAQPDPLSAIPFTQKRKRQTSNSSISSTPLLQSASTANFSRGQSVASTTVSTTKAKSTSKHHTTEVIPKFDTPALSQDCVISYATPKAEEEARMSLGIVRQIRTERPGDFQESEVLVVMRYVVSGDEFMMSEDEGEEAWRTAFRSCLERKKSLGM